MRTVFVDTAYWAAVIRPRDQWRQAALRAEKELGNVRLVTTYEVLTEALTSLAGNPDRRKKAVDMVCKARENPLVEVISQSRELRTPKKESIFPPCSYRITTARGY